MSRKLPAPPSLRPLAILLVALSLSIGWGVRGNWGHEFGAMIPGALAAVAAVLVSGRPDWHRRVAFFAMFGALGWSFGGSISYMVVIGYTHHPAYFDTCLWGFSGLFLIGFCWGAIGAGGTALPAVLSRDRLTEFFVPLLMVFAAWFIEAWLMIFAESEATWLEDRTGTFLATIVRQFHYDARLNWFDSDWLAALFALWAIGLLAVIRRPGRLRLPILLYAAIGGALGYLLTAVLGLELPRPADEGFSPGVANWGGVLGVTVAISIYLATRGLFDRASLLICYLSVGWFVGFLLLIELPLVILNDPLAVGLRMTPPRGDNWAGVLGMTAGMFLFFIRHRLSNAAWAAMVGGLFGGLGFSGAAFIKLMAITSDIQTNWHSVLEQTFGFISGIGIAIVMGVLSRGTPNVEDEPPVRRWTEPVAIIFILLLMTYLSISKNLWSVWFQIPGGMTRSPVPEEMYGVSTIAWFNLAYGLLCLAVIVPLLAHYRGRRVALLPESWLGRGQLLFIVLLWWIVLGNLSRYLPFEPVRLVTEGTIHLNACLCVILALVLPQVTASAPIRAVSNFRHALWQTTKWGVVFAVVVVLAETTITRAVHGPTHAGHSGVHVRFGPDNTNQPD